MSGRTLALCDHDEIDLSNGVVILSDQSLGSYAVIGDLLAATFTRDGIAVDQRALDEGYVPVLESAPVSRPVVHNTIGPRFAPSPGTTNIALVHHEWDRYPRAWVERLNGFDWIWVTTEFVGKVLSVSGVRKPIRLVRPALDLEPVPERRTYRLEQPFRVLACGEPHFRKGFHLLVEGFLAAFPTPDEAILTIKTSPSCSWTSPRRDVQIVTARLDRAAWLGQYRNHDLYVTASLGEGLGLPVAEAILAGVPVAATYWGGHESLLQPGAFYRIPHRVVPQPFCSSLEFYAAGQRCAYADPRAIAATLRRAARASAAERRTMATRARVALRERYGWKAVSKQAA